MLTRDTAVQYGRDGVRANAVAPGHLFTPMVSGFSEEAKSRRRSIAPLGIEGTAWDVADAVVFLASDAARFVSGVLLPVDGGATVVQPLKAADFLQ
jgi:NAD(P)-dependent dehydrogenase (short-subunit alcohol dehydrogenase family)